LESGALLASFLALGIGWASLRAVRLAGSPLVQLRGTTVRVIGVLGTQPVPRPVGWTATLKVDIVVPAGGTSAIATRTHDSVWVEGRGRVPPVSIGDRVETIGLLTSVRGSFGTYLRQRGLAGALQADDVRRLAPPSGWVTRAAEAVRSALRGSLRRVLPPHEAGLVMGLALGDTSMIDPRVREDFRATGLSHLTAVSGENVAMFLAPIMGLGMLVGLSRRGRFILGIASVSFFVVLTRGEPSVLRAAVMSGLTMLGIFLGRPRSPPSIVGGAVLLLLGLDPSLVYAIGFQLSVAATVGMALLATPIADRLRFLPRGIALAAATTLAAQAGVSPLLLYHFGVVPTVSLPANPLAFPAVGAGMNLGLAAAACGLVARPVGLFLGVMARIPLGYLESLADRLARSPLPSLTSDPGHLFPLLVGLVLLVGAAWAVHSGARIRGRLIVALAVILPIFVWTSALGAGAPSTFTVTFFDVGQGDGALIRSPAGASILIDGGPDAEEVARKLASLGVRRLDLLVATHPHADHVGGLPAVLTRFAVALVVDPDAGETRPSTPTSFGRFEPEACRSSIPVPARSCTWATSALRSWGPSAASPGRTPTPTTTR
jgi:competence protein ComEC